MKKYECIKELHVDCYDGDGHFEEKQNTIPTGSIWVVEDEENPFRMIGGEIRLIKEVENEYSWLEITQDTLDNHFKLFNE